MRATPSCTLSARPSPPRRALPIRYKNVLLALVLGCCGMTSQPLRAQTAGQNVNMVSGTGWTNGDPFLERQNEPSIAVSTRNSAHLFGSANDYRSVDLPGLLGIDERGDAWLGVYKSFDGGLTWQSTLLPGFPLDGSPEGLASPIHGRQAAADPLVRSGSNGLFFLTGLAFDRGASPLSKVFITRFIDLNNKENGDAASENGSLTNLAPRDPLKYIDTHIIDTGSANRFLDKPWVAVDIPRGRATCTISANEDGNSVTQKVPAGAIYVTYTAFTTVGTVQNSQILFKRSMDCGVTWTKPIVLSQSDDRPGQPDAEGQGTVIAIDPSVPAYDPATIYVAWRVFAEPGDPDDANRIMIAKSTDGGLSFDEQEAAVTFPLSCNKKPTGAGCPFDQGETGTSFRSNGYPALTVDNVGRIYLAWSQRDSKGDGRIMMAVTNRVESWPPSNFSQIDSGPVYDDYGYPLSNLSDRGGQLMPTLNFNAGKLMLTYYDLRQDHTSGTLTPAPEPTCNPALTPLCPIGNPFSELRQLEGELLTNPMAVFSAYIDDATLTVRRHTLDIIGSEGSPDSNRWSLAVPSFSHFRVSRYEYGIIPPGTDVQQAQFNAPNLPMFVQGTAPFMGDYIDVAGAPSMLPDNSRNSNGWKFNTSPTTNPVFHATWTDNRDVLPPPDGISWNKYTPPISASIGPTSKFDPTQTPPACVPGYSGMRNQNIYTSAISHGLILTSPQTAKPVLQANGQPIPREFALVMRNDTTESRTFQLTIPAQPPTAQASFLQFSLVTTLVVNIPALSSASRPVFLAPKAGSAVSFPSFEVDALETDGAVPALTAAILFNADPTNPLLANPDNASFGAGSISSEEFYNPAILNPAILNPAILNPAILNPAILNPAILNPAILNPAILNPAILNPNFVVALNPAILNPAILNPAILNNAVANPAILNPAILNTPVSDANYTITNEGNTSATYQLQLFQSGALPTGAVFQIILTKTYLTPGVSPTDGCTYGGQVNNEVIASIDNPAFVTDPTKLGNPAILNSAINNPTFSMAPGDTVEITLRANLTVTELANVVLPNLTPVVAAQAVNTVDVAKGITTPPISLLVSTPALASPVTGQPYSATLTALGGNPPLSADTWSVVGGALPPGLNLSAAGVVSGTPTATGTFAFVVEVSDTGTPPHVASRQFALTVVAPVAITTPALPNVAPGASYTQVVAVTGGMPPYTWSSTGTLPPGLTLSATTGVISGVPTTAGTYTFSVMVSDSLGLVATSSYTIVVSTSATQPAQVAFAVQPSNVVGSVAISPAVQVQVLSATGAPIPNVPVTMSMANPACPSAALAGTLTATTNASGTASFVNLGIDHGQRNYTLAATAGNAVAVSNPFNVEGYCETANMNVARHNHIVLGLPNGKVLITGGAVNPNGSGALASAELYDPLAHTFTTIAPMNVARVDQTVTLLPNGKVLIAGGFNDAGVLSSAELFDPATNTFTLLTAPMTSLRAEHTATLLASGKVLIAGGNNNSTSLATAEIFDPAANTFTPSAHLMGSVRQIHHADLLANGQVLVSGGFDANNNALGSAEIYDPNADTFTPTGSMTTARGNHASALLYNGQILVAGGLTGPGTALVLTPTAELYNPLTALFTPTGSMSVGRGHYTGTVLDDGTVFISGGATPPAGTNADVFDPASGTFRTTANFTAVQAGMRESILPDGTVVLTSGVNSNSAVVPNSEVFYPLGAPAGITITTSVLPNAVQNQPYTQLFLEHGGVGNLTWSAPVESLPPGLVLSSGGILSGAPTATGTFTFTVNVADSASPPKSAASGTLTLTVSQAVPPLVLAPQSLPTDFTNTTSYAPSLAASGGTPPYTFAATSGALPTGITLGTSGTFSGSSTSVGSFTFGVTVTDSSAPAETATQTFTIRVAAPLAITTSTLPGGTAGVAYSANIFSAGGVLPVGFTVTAGNLPPGLTLAPAAAPPATATLGGSPTSAGTFIFTITATDSSVPAATASAAYSITIAPAVVPPANVIFVTPPQNSVEGQILTGSPVQVRVTDATNTPLPNATVSMGLNGAPPCAAATLGGTLAQITDATGTAAFPDLTINRGQYGFSLAATAGGVTGVSNPFHVEGYCDTGSLATARALHSSVTLPNGMVLIAGGSPSFSNRAVAFASAELYNPATHTFAAAGSMHVGRSAFSMTLLQNGLILVAGGLNGTAAVASAELFDPSTNTFTLLSNSMVTARVEHIATLLANGKVLITGGNSNGTELASAEIFDPATNTFTATNQPMTTARDLHQAALLPNGQVLITGGFANSGPSNALASAELYDPVRDTFTATGSMATPRYEHASALLFTGKVLVGGGFSGNNFTTPLAAAEIYDPSTGTFSPTTSAPETLAGFLSSVPVLADGTVFLEGSVDAQIYDPTAGTFRRTGNTTTLQGQPLTALMADGTVLVTGGVGSDGSTGIANAEIFYPTNVVPISITTVLPTALVNVPYSQQLQEKGGVGALTWTLSSGTLPTGVTLGPGGLLSGTPTVVGAYVFSVQVQDSSTPPRTTTANYAVAVVPPVTVVPALPTANPGVAYSSPLLIVGGRGPYTSSIVSGALPSGLTLSNGTVSGTTTALGNFTFTVKVTDSSSPPVTVTQAVNMTVALPLAFVTTALPGSQANVAYPTTTIATSGGAGAVQLVVASGTLPTGLTLTPQGVLSGIPTVAASFTFTLAAVDSSADPQIVEQTFTVVIAPAVTPVTLGPASLPAATIGAAYLQNFLVSGGTPPYTVTQTGTLPPGLAFNGAGNPPSVTGTPTSLGSFGNIVVTATDSLGAQAQVTYSITVNAFSAACGTGSESLLKGQYAILMQGFDANGPRTLLASIAANGAGGFTSGQIDIGTDLPTGGGAAQHLALVPAASSFSVGADQRGCMVLTTSLGSSSYRFALATVTSGLSTGGRIIDFQQNGAYGAGFFRLQDPAFLAAASLSGSYAFLFSTPSSLANIGHWAMLGSFAASGGAVSGGSWDYNDSHAIDAGSAWATSGLSFPANETYAFDTTGRGTLQLPSVQQYSQSNTLVSANLVVYPINANEMYAAVLPDASNKPLVGDIQQQVTPFSSLTLNGAGFVDGASSAPIFSGAWVGLFSASQNAWSLALDNDFADVYSTSVSGGTYSVDSTGRAPLVFTGSASPAPMLRVIGPNKAYFMLADSTSAVGFVHGFSGGVPPSSVAGSYALGATEGTMDRKVTNLVGVVVFDAAGNVTFTQDQATGSTNTLTPGAVLTSTYSYNAATGRGVIPATGTPHFVFDSTAGGVMYLLDVTSVDPEVQQLEAFAPPAVTLSPDPLNLVVGTSGSMAVILAGAATGNGQVVTLASSDSTIASVPASVTVLAGTQGVGFQVTAGANAGSAVISASIPGSPAANASVVVSPLTMSVALDSPLLAINRSFNATVSLVQPAGAGGVTVGLSGAPSGLVTISPASQSIAAGETTAVFLITAGGSSGSVVLTASASGYVSASAPLAVTSNLISFGTIPVLGPGQSASLPVSLSFAAPTGGLTINFASSSSAVASVTPSVFVPAGLLIPSANPQVTGVTIGSAQINATATGFAPDTANVSVTVTGALSPSPISVNATRAVNVTLTISAAAPAGGITFNLTSDNTGAATVPATVTVLQGQLSVTFPVTGVAQGSANLSISSPGITTITSSITVSAAPTINLGDIIVGNNTIIQGNLGLSAAAPPPPANPTLTLTTSDPTHFLLTLDSTKVGTASLTLPLTPGSFSVPAFYIEGQNYSGTTAITATLTASSQGYANGTSTLTLYPTGLTYWPSSSSAVNTTAFSPPTILTIYLVLLTPGTLGAYTYGYPLGPQAPGAVPVSLTDTNTAVGTLPGNPATIGVGTYFTQAISFVPAAVGTANLNLATPPGYFTPGNVPVQSVVTVTSPAITVNSQVIGNNLIAQGGVSLAAAPPASPANPTITLTSSDPAHFLLTADSTKIGTASITLPLTPGSTGVPAFYIEGQNYSGSTAITATLTASSQGYANGTGTLTLYPTGVTYWPGGSSTINTTTFSPPTILTLYLVLLTPGTLDAYTYGYPLGPQAPGAVPISLTDTNTAAGTLTGNPASIGVGTYFTQGISFIPAGAGTANLNLATPSGYSMPANVPVQSVATVTAPAINVSSQVVGNNLIEQGSFSLGAAPPASPASPTVTLTSSDPAHFLLTADSTKVGTASITLALTPGTTSVPAFYVEGQNYSGTTAITATLTASSSGYATGTATMTLYPTGVTYWPGASSAINTTTFSQPTSLTVFLALLSPGTLNAYTYGYPLGPQASAVPVSLTDTNTTVGSLTGNPATIAVGTYFTQAISFVPATAGTTNLNLATPAGYSTPANVPVQSVVTVTAPAISLSSPVIGNNLVEQGSVSLGAAPPSSETLTLTSSDPTHFLLSPDATKVGTGQIKLALTAGSLSIPAFYIEGQNFSGAGAITATLTASAAGYSDGTFTLTLYPTGLSYWPSSSGSLNTTTTSSPSVLTVYLVLLSPGTLNAYTYGFLLGPQAPGAVPVSVTSTNTTVGTVTGGPASIVAGTYFTQALSFVPATTGTTNLNLATPAGYSTPANVAVQIAVTVQ
jgi:Putative Ig domain/Galactose oxidase, central domain